MKEQMTNLVGVWGGRGGRGGSTRSPPEPKTMLGHLLLGFGFPVVVHMAGVR
jgi:hypothetical protein